MIGVPTGFTELDELTHGLHPGQMIVLAARPAVGKSTMGLDIARSAAIKHKHGRPPSSRLEMSRTEITMRLLSAEAQIQLQDLRKGTHRRRATGPSWPAPWARSPTRRCSSTTRPTCR